MKKTELQKKWENLSQEPGWKSAGPEAIAKVKSRNAAMKSAKEKKDEKFTARLSTADFQALKDAAENEGMGYQTLLGSIVHKYVTGQLVDLKTVQKIVGLNASSFKAKKSS